MTETGMWLRLMGCVLVTVACGGLGAARARQWSEHRKMLEQLRKMIYLLRGEILYAHAPLGEALERSAAKTPGPLGIWFSQIAERIRRQEGDSLFVIWQEELDRQKKKLLLSQRELQELGELGQHLGYLDLEMQERTIALYLEQLDMAIGFYREHEQERMKMCTSLGIMGGLFLAVILC